MDEEKVACTREDLHNKRKGRNRRKQEGREGVGIKMKAEGEDGKDEDHEDEEEGAQNLLLSIFPRASLPSSRRDLSHKSGSSSSSSSSFSSSFSSSSGAHAQSGRLSSPLTLQGLQPEGGERQGKKRGYEREKRRERGRGRGGRRGARRTGDQKGRGKGRGGGDDARRDGEGESTERVASNSAIWYWEDQKVGEKADENTRAGAVPVLDDEVLKMLFDEGSG